MQVLGLYTLNQDIVFKDIIINTNIIGSIRCCLSKVFYIFNI